MNGIWIRARRLVGASGIFGLIALAACGGGGGRGGEEPPPAGPPQITRAAGGSISSADGKLRLEVAPNSASADAAATLTAVTPPADMLADPDYLPGSAYRWDGPDIDFGTPAEWDFKPDAVASAAEGRKSRLGVFDFITPFSKCDAAFLEANNLEPQAFTILWGSCPSGCAKVAGQLLPPPETSVCVPVLDGKLVRAGFRCPPMTVAADNEEPYATIVAEAESESTIDYTICKPIPIGAGPWISSGVLASTPALGCLIAPASLKCQVERVRNRAVYGLFKDTTPPTSATLLVDNAPARPYLEFVNADSSWTVFVAAPVDRIVPLAVNVNALQEKTGLRQIELREVIYSPGTPSTGPSISNVVRWSVVPTGSSLPAGTKEYSSAAAGHEVAFSYASTDRTTRRFFVRAYDWAGNARDSATVTFRLKPPPAPVINSFTASPNQIAPPGGSTTLAWNVAGAATVSIDQGIGSVPASGSTTVNVNANTTFTLTARSPLNVVTTLPLAVTIGADTSAPTVSLAANATSVMAPASVTLTATATDAVGVARVDFYRGSTLIASDSTAADGFQHTVSFTPADAGTPSFTARAFDAAGNNSTSAAVTITVGTDAQAPTVTLASSASTVLAPGSITLTAAASDNVGVTRVDFYRGSTLIGSDTNGGDGFTQSVSFTTADVGSVDFSARAFDAMNNQGTSGTVTVAVTLPASGDTYASPSGNDTSSTCSQAAPCRTINKAAVTAAAAGPGRTTWLMDGSYTTATQGFSGAALPAGTTLRAANAGVPIVKVRLVPAGNATIGGLRLGAGGGLQATSGTIALEGVDFVETLNLPLQLGGTAAVTMTPGTIADYIAGASEVAPGGGVGPLAQLAASASLTVNGGAFGLGTRGIGSAGQAAFQHNGTGTLTLNGVPVKTHHHGVAVSGAGAVVLTNSPVQRAGSPAAALSGLIFTGTGGTATIDNSSIGGFAFGGNSAAVAVSGTASITATGSAFANSSQGVRVTGSATLNLTNTQIHDNLFAGVACSGACSLAMNGGAVRDNARYNASTGWSYQGGLYFGGGVAHSVSLRNVAVIDNRNTVVDGSTNQAANSGITLIGNAGSVFDLGTAASPGGNTFTGNTTGNLTAGIHVNTAVGVTVNAVGNTFIAGTQGASSTGQYQLGTTPCGTSSCVLGSGTGSNYRITSGSIRLAQ